MHIFWSLVSLSAAVSCTQVLNPNLENRSPLRFLRRGLPFSNTSLPVENFASSSTTPSITTVATSDYSTTSLINSETEPSEPPLKTPPPLPSTIPPSTGPTLSYSFSNSSTSSTTTSTNTTETPLCTGSVTYYGSVPPTVYLTVTEGFEVTVTASNVSVTETPTLVTPLPACQATIMPLIGSFAPEAATPAKSVPDITGTGTDPVQGTDNPLAEPEPNVPAAPPHATPMATTVPAAASSVYSSVDYTSTVIVTKKTPVTVVAPPTTEPGVNFQFPTQTPTPGNDGPNSPPTNGGGGGPNNNNDGPSANDNGNAPSQNPPGHSNPTPTSNNFPSVNNQGPTQGTLITNSPTATGLGNIIASIINSPFVPAAPTGRAPAAPFTTIVDNVPIVVLPSSVVIGSQTVAIPAFASTTVEANGAIFTLRPTEIVAPAGTITISPAQQDQVVTPVPTAAITTTVDQLTFTIGPTIAVISGTTYRIGAGAPATTITVDGTRVSIGSNGVGLPSTTVPPGGGSRTGSHFLIVTAEGLTFSIDATQAIVSGTTYRIGSNAPQVTTTIGTESVSFGPKGVGLDETTILPTTGTSRTRTAVTTTSTEPESTTRPTQTAGLVANAASSWTKVPVSKMLGWNLVAGTIGLGFVWFVL